MTMTLADGLAEIQEKMLRRNRYCSINAESRLEARCRIRSLLRLARKRGAIEILWRGSKPRAAVILAYATPYYSNRTLRTQGQILVDSGDRVAMAWVKKTLLKHEPLIRKRAFIQLHPSLGALLPVFESCHAYLHAIILAGDPRVSLKTLERRYGALDWSNVRGLHLETLKTREQLKQMLGIIRREFNRNPQFGSFVGSRDNLQRAYRKFLVELKRRRPTTYVILDANRKVQGYFAFDPRRRSFLGRKTCGVELAFDQKIQGRGLAPFAYATMFREMIRRNCRVYLGGTSQPPILRLSRLMRRELVGYALEGQKPYFPRRYFQFPGS